MKCLWILPCDHMEPDATGMSLFGVYSHAQVIRIPDRLREFSVAVRFYGAARETIKCIVEIRHPGGFRQTIREVSGAMGAAGYLDALLVAPDFTLPTAGEYTIAARVEDRDLLAVPFIVTLISVQ